MSRPVSVKVRDAHGGLREIGHMCNNNTCFVSFRTESKHAYRNGAPTLDHALRSGLACWCMDEQALVGLKSRGVRTIYIVGRNTVYSVPLEMFTGPASFRVDHGGHRPQRGLNFKEFNRAPRSDGFEDVLRGWGLSP